MLRLSIIQAYVMWMAHYLCCCKSDTDVSYRFLDQEFDWEERKHNGK